METLEIDLQSCTIEFFTKEKYSQVDDDKKELRLSDIMKFYSTDYVPSGKKHNLLPCLNQYRHNTVPDDHKVSYLKYDEKIDQQPEPVEQTKNNLG